jgi:hypothetical protein
MLALDTARIGWVRHQIFIEQCPCNDGCAYIGRVAEQEVLGGKGITRCKGVGRLRSISHYWLARVAPSYRYGNVGGSLPFDYEDYAYGIC